MAIHKFFLGAATSLALAGAIVASPPVTAQHYPRVSSPSERAETRALNLQAVKGITVRPTAEEQADYDAERTEYAVAQAQYGAQVEDNDAETRVYERQQQNYDGQADAYEDQSDDYADQSMNGTYENSPQQDAENFMPDDGAIADDEATTIASDADPFDGLWTLDKLNNPSRELFNMPVEDINGFLVGHFRRVETRENGERMAVVTLKSLQTIALFEDDVRFDPDRAVLVTALSTNELDLVAPG